MHLNSNNKISQMVNFLNFFLTNFLQKIFFVGYSQKVKKLNKNYKNDKKV